MYQSVRNPAFRPETKARRGRFMQPLVVVSCLVLLGVGAGAAWIFRDQLTTPPKPGEPRAEYDALVEKLGGDEPTIRNELNELICTSSAVMEPSDKTKAHTLT